MPSRSHPKPLLRKERSRGGAKNRGLVMFATWAQTEVYATELRMTRALVLKMKKLVLE